MENDLVEILETIADVDGSVSIRDLSEEEIARLNDKTLWTYSDQRNADCLCRFGDDKFRPEGERDNVIIPTDSSVFDYELKAMMLLMRHIGLKEGGRPLKWKTIYSRIAIIRRFALYSSKRGVNSFRNLNQVPELRLRNMLFGFLNDSHNLGGLNVRKNTSNYEIAYRSLKHLTDYKLLSKQFVKLLDELTRHQIENHKTNHQLRHSIIPTGVMKNIIAEAVRYIRNAEANFDALARKFEQANKDIAEVRYRNWYASYIQPRRELGDIYALFNKNFSGLQLHTYALVLAFTGMRDNEVGALRTGCGGYKVEHAEKHYYITSLLSKTDDNVIALDWVANELAYEAVTLLSMVNELFYQRAELVKKYYLKSLSSKQIRAIDHGLKNKFLFGVSFYIGSVSFHVRTHSTCGREPLMLSRYKFTVSAQDLAQLEQMECNYRSVTCRSNRGIPYRVGDTFKVTAHMFRHTFAWFIVANRLGDISDIKYQFKHLREAMTLIYAERGYKSLNELRSVIEDFETIVNQQCVNDIVASAANNTIAGGGGDRLANMLQDLNADVGSEVFGTEQQPHFKDMREVISYTTRHSESIRGLPHGYCTRGPSCKIKNAADPSHCLYCDTYFATPKHVPYWQSIRANCEDKLERITNMPEDAQQRYEAFRQSLEDNLFAANEVLARLLPSSISKKGTTI